MSSPAVIPVVCAIIERDGRVLVAQRPAGKPLPLKWEFPGGKVEAGETPTDALRREIREELGCSLGELTALPASRHQYEHATIEMLPFIAPLSVDSPEPAPTEHAAIRWVGPRELLSLDLAAADLPIIGNYLAQR